MTGTIMTNRLERISREERSERERYEIHIIYGYNLVKKGCRRVPSEALILALHTYICREEDPLGREKRRGHEDG